MSLWFIFVLILGGSVAALLAPFFVGSRQITRREDFDIAIFRDQLREIQADLDRGILTPDEAARASAEVSKKLLAADRAKQTQGEQAAAKKKQLILPVIGLGVPLVAFVCYLFLGSPQLPSQPRADREIVQTLNVLQQKVQSDPSDGDAWYQMGQIYLQVQDFGSAVASFEQAVSVGTPKAEFLVSYGIALVFAADGGVDERAEQMFAQTLELSPNLAIAHYFIGLAHAQRQDFGRARVSFTTALGNAAPDEPWVAAARRQLEFINANFGAGDAGQPSLEGAGAIASLEPEDQALAIRGMVDGLAAKLEEEPRDLEGWMMLARSYMVLQERESAREALDKAEEIHADEPAALEQIRGARQEFGLSE